MDTDKVPQYRLTLELTPETVEVIMERAEVIGISPAELASASVAFVADMPIAVAAGICAAYLDEDAFDEPDTDTNTSGDGSGI